MEITKAYWLSENDRVSLSMPISKINHESRTVSGYASVDNLDEHGDIITADCAQEAFSRFRGNLREMHQHIAVGKVVDFNQRPVYDAESDKIYNGIYVTAYISTGAQDTWEKVVDGTLSGFSIGGNLVESEEIFDKNIGHPVRIVTKMDLHELSLVDNPANQLANVVSIQKVNDDNVATGIAVDVRTESIFWCDNDQLSLFGSDGTQPMCPKCEDGMENIGWIESDANQKAKMEKMRQIVSSHIIKKSKEGGVENMSEEVNADEHEVVEEIESVEEVEIAEPVAAEVTEPVAEEQSSESDDQEPVVEAKADTESVQETAAQELDADALIAQFRAELAEMREFMSQSLASVSKSIEETFKETKKSFDKVDAVKSELSDFQTQFSEVSEKVDNLISDTAVKKSGELGRESGKMKKGLWSGKFLTAEEL